MFVVVFYAGLTKLCLFKLQRYSKYLFLSFFITKKHLIFCRFAIIDISWFTSKDNSFLQSHYCTLLSNMSSPKTSVKLMISLVTWHYIR